MSAQVLPRHKVGGYMDLVWNRNPPRRHHGLHRGHDASCFTRYGPAEETFTLGLGSGSRLGLPVGYG